MCSSIQELDRQVRKYEIFFVTSYRNSIMNGRLTNENRQANRILVIEI